MDLKKLWRKFDHGDHLTTPELVVLADSARQGENYLAARREVLSLFKTRFDLSRIEGYLEARKQK